MREVLVFVRCFCRAGEWQWEVANVVGESVALVIEVQGWVEASLLCMSAFNRNLPEARCLNAKDLNPYDEDFRQVCEREILCGVWGLSSNHAHLDKHLPLPYLPGRGPESWHLGRGQAWDSAMEKCWRYDHVVIHTYTLSLVSEWLITGFEFTLPTCGPRYTSFKGAGPRPCQGWGWQMAILGCSLPSPRGIQNLKASELGGTLEAQWV